MDFFNHTLLGLFLYFPEDKTEYISAGITCFIFLVAAVFTMRAIIRYSKKEELKTKQLEDEVTKRNRRIKEDSLS
jgi:multisubunit Na+/H+ antiporter MnhG subunit